MDENSVGAVSLELVVENRINKQIEAAAKGAIKPAEKSFANVGKSIQKSLYASLDTMQAKIYDKITKPYEKAMKKVKQMQPSLPNDKPNKNESKGFKVNSNSSGLQEQTSKSVEKATLTAEKATQSLADKSKKSTKGATSSMAGGFAKLGKSVIGSFKSMFLMPALNAFFGAFQKNISNALSKNKEFSKSLNSIKSNLSVAFTPIIEAVMPLITKLASGLATISKYVATFMARIFGKSYAQAVDTTKKLQGEAKKAENATSRDFDELHTVEEPDQSASGGADFGALDMTPVDKEVDGFIARTKAKFGELGGADLFSTLKGFWGEFSQQISECDFKTPLKSGISNAVGLVFASADLLAKAVFPIAIGLNIPAIVETTLETLSSILGTLRDTIKGITPHVEKFVEKGLKPIAVWVGDKIRDALKFVADQFKKFGDWIVEHAGILDKLGELLGLIWEAIEPLLSAAWEGIKNGIGGIVDIFLSVGGTALDVATDLIDAVIKILKGDWSGLADVGKNIIDGLINGAKDYWQKLKDFWGQLIDDVIVYIKALFGIHSPSTVFADIAGNLVSGMVEGLKNTWNNVVTFFSDKFNALKNTVSEKFTGIKNTILNLLESAKSAIRTKFDGIWDGIKGFINKVIGGIETMINKPIGALNKLIDKLNQFKVDIPEALGGGKIGFNISRFSTVSIPRLAKGGIVNKPTLSLIGEAGKEAVVPLQNNTGWMDKVGAVIAKYIVSAFGSMPQNMTYETNGQSGDIVLTIDGKSFAKITMDMIYKYGETKGRLGLEGI